MIEDVVMRELYNLPYTYYIFNDIHLSLYRAVKYKNTQKNVKMCQIDYVVIGPTGIFIIEAKKWSEWILKEDKLLPLKDAEKAGLVFYIKTINWFHRKFPIYNVAVMLSKVPKVQYGYVHHLSLRQLYWFILRREGILSKKKIRKIVKWLAQVSNKKAIIRRIPSGKGGKSEY